MMGSGLDNAQWLSINEDALFLHDGLIRVTDLVDLPTDGQASSDADHEVITFDTKNPRELSQRILTLCGKQNNTYARLMEYRLNALRGLWNAQRQLAIEPDRESSENEETLLLLRKQGLWQQTEPTSFSSRVSLLLVFPLLQSQSRTDPTLCGITTDLLLHCLRDCPPLSLAKEPSDCLQGLENLLCNWLGEDASENALINIREAVQKENAAAALVALACARGSVKTFIHTVHLLQNLPDLGSLSVADVLHKLLALEGGPGCPSSLLGSKHILCWDFEDFLTAPPEKDNVDKEKDNDYRRSIACDGKFLYTTSCSGHNLAKIGNGYHGTLRCCLYARNTTLGPGLVAWGSGVLLFRPYDFDSEKEDGRLAMLLNPSTLQAEGVVILPLDRIPDIAVTTIQFTSDGCYFFWIWVPRVSTDKKGQPVYVDVLRLKENEVESVAVQKRVILQRKDEASNKGFNESLLARFRPFRSTAAATLVALTGTSSSASTPSQEVTSNTSTGLPLKNLTRAPLYTCGNTIVILSSAPGSGSNSTARSLFGSGSNLASLRALTINVCFNVSDGQYNSRSDLVDAPACALARGAPLQSLGLCYDALNNMIWSCSNHWIDQFYNPGHQASHHVSLRLGTDTSLHQVPEDNRYTLPEVIRLLMQHVGSKCFHQITCDLVNTPAGTLLFQQKLVNLVHFRRILDVLEISLRAGDPQIINCTLVVLQVLFKTFRFKLENPTEVLLVKRTNTLVWQLITSSPSNSSFRQSQFGPQRWYGIQAEACNVIVMGLHVLYPLPRDRNNLLHQLFNEGCSEGPLTHLRDLILIQYTEQLQNSSISAEEAVQFRLSDELVYFLLKIVVRESCMLLRKCVIADREEFDKVLTSVPMSSPSLRYLSALQSHLLREAVLYKKPSEEDTASGLPSSTVSSAPSGSSLEHLQGLALGFATQVLSGAYEVLEVLLEVSSSVINGSISDYDYWVSGLERVTKATILGHLVPVLMTSLTHPNLCCLKMADAILPQLVQIVIVASQAALLLRNQSQAGRPIPGVGTSADGDAAELPTESSASENLEESGFLSGLKVPAPWATGRTVESIHPVRDNYKFKEVVQIPGARCLYLRFDPRCSSQYDYDKLVIYAGPNTNSKKVIEYGGNTFGYGSRSVLGSGWPKDLVKVDGDTVTFSFEMRSGREHNTPDKAVWGFAITVRAQESAEELSSGLPFLADVALGLSVLSCTMLKLLYQGPQKTVEESNCEQLLQSRLLLRCVWQAEPCLLKTSSSSNGNQVIPIDENSELVSPSVSVPLSQPWISSEKLRRLREMSGCVSPQLRPSIRDCIHPEVLEERLISCVVKHVALGDIVRQVSMHQEHNTSDYLILIDVLKEAFRKIDSITRRLQAVAELEQRWLSELNDVAQGLLFPGATFYSDYHMSEVRRKELALLCFLKNVDFENLNLEECVHSLRQKMESEAAAITEPATEMVETKKLVAALLERTEILLHVTIDHETHPSTSKSREGSPGSESIKKPGYNRSISAPSALEGHIHRDSAASRKAKAQRKRMSYPWQPSAIFQEGTHNMDVDHELPLHLIILEQLFAFVSSNPKDMISCASYLSAAQTRYQRGNTRTQALVHMKDLLTAAARVGGATHLVAAVTSVLQKGPRIEDLTCGGMVQNVRKAFAAAMTSVVQLASRYPIACCNTVGLLCVIPYSRNEEPCLVQSGLVHLLDRLCSLSNYRGDGASDAQSVRQRVSAMAWAGFQVLSNCCVMWEQEEESYTERLQHSGLASQVATLLTNHLARATENNGNEAADSETLQEVLSLLNNLSRSKMGKAILSQPACVSKLLSLLLDQRPSPKLVLIILQLCRVALPLMSADDCAKVILPPWASDLQMEDEEQSIACSDPAVRIASLLLAKLGDYVIPGCQTTISRRGSQESGENGGTTGSPGASVQDNERDEADTQDSRVSVFIHKREDQTSHEVIQPLISCTSDNRVFRMGTGGNIERVVRMDRELSKHGRMEMCTEDASSAWRRATKLAQSGLVVSIGPPVEGLATDQPLDKKKSAVDVSCKDKNAELAKTDPVRPFISGHVANSMASEVIALLHSLLTATADEIWAAAVQQVLGKALALLPQVTQRMEFIGTPQCNLQHLMSLSCRVNAALCALGGFKESIKAGSEVEITGKGITNSHGQILSISEPQGIATVKLDIPGDGSIYPRASDIMNIPISRLTPPRNVPLPLDQLSLTQHLVSALHSLLVSENGKSPLQLPINNQGESSLLSMAVCRVIAEIRTRACMVLAQNLRDSTFAMAFMQHSGRSIDVLKSLAKDCSAGCRLPVAEVQCERLRMLYRDCAKPPLPPSKANGRMKEITLDPSRPYPPVRASVFSQMMTAITFLGDPSNSSGLPRGTLVYGAQPIPQQAPSFYWELEICTYGESQDDSGPIISFGFAPSAEKKEGAWTNPVGTVLFHNNGRAVHYNGSSLLQWKSVRLDVSLNPGDVAGCGWERTGETPELPVQQAKGTVFFTHNGQRLSAVLEDVSGGLWPIVHIQKKNTRVRANFGARPFSYAEGQQHRNAANEAADSTEEISANFGILPFHGGSDTESDNSERLNLSSDGRDGRGSRGVPCRVPTTPKPLREYNSESSLHYKLPLSYSAFLLTGPNPHVPLGNQDEESETEDGDDKAQQEDHHALLVKAWESKVFPIIRRRFRNEAERKDGLEQIRGALQLGMTDIARQTVEFLYEENGGMPRDLHLPTLEDIKEEASKFSIDRIRKGTAVIIRSPGTTACGTTVLPKYAVHSMLKTFGLTGVVLDIDTQQELIQVETYLRSEGILVRYWYPVDILERPAAGFRKTAVTGAQILDMNSVHIHRELIVCESILSKLYCRRALLELIDHCNNPDFSLEHFSLSTAMAASAALLQELDIENLQLLSNELLSPPSPGGTVGETSLNQCHDPGRLLTAQTNLVTSLFYDEHDWLCRELVSAISRTANQGEDYLIELTTQICLCLQLAPETFPSEEFSLAEAKTATDVHFPGASFVIASCKSDPKAVKKDPQAAKSVPARIYTYSGHQVKKNGQVVRQEVICYPRDAASSVTGSPPVGNQFPSVVLPCDRVHVRLGGCASPGMILMLHAVPPQLPLAVAYIEVLLSEKLKELPTRRSTTVTDADGPVIIDAKPPPKITSAVLLHVIELVGNYLWRTDIPALLKERLFHLLAELLRTLHHAEDFSEDSSFFPMLGPQLSPSLALLLQLQSELRKLYEEETKTWTSSSTPSGVGMGLGVGDHGRFSSYFHALMEVSLAVAEVTSPITPALCSSGLGLAASMQGGTSPPPTAAPSSPSASSKRKKLKAKRDRDRMSPKSRSGSSSPRSSICEMDTTGASSSSSCGGALSVSSIDKPEDTLWFHRALTMSQILRYVVYGDPQGSAVTSDAISDASQSLVTPTAPSRLLVMTGIPTHLSEEQVKKAIRSTLTSIGGLYRDDVFVPIIDFCAVESPSEPKTSDQQEEVQSKLIKGCAIIEVRSRAKMEMARTLLLKSKELIGGLGLDIGSVADDILDVPENILSISTVNQSLQTSDAEDAPALELYLQDKLLLSMNSTDLNDNALIALTEIFHSCFLAEQRMSLSETQHSSGFICLSKDQIMSQIQGNLLGTFFSNVRASKRSLQEHISFVLAHYGLSKTKDKTDEEDKSETDEKEGKLLTKKKWKGKMAIQKEDATSKDKERHHSGSEKVSKDGVEGEVETGTGSGEEKFLTLDGFAQYVCDRAQQDVRAVWLGFLACGYDLHFDRCSCMDTTQAQLMSKLWTTEMDAALATYTNALCRHLAITPARLHPHEIYLSPAELSSPEYSCLQEAPLESIRLRFALLQSLNSSLETFFLPLVDLRTASSFPHSTAALLAQGRGLILYDTKVTLANRVLNATVLRKPGQAAPEIILDPLETIGNDVRDVMHTQFCQAYRQLAEVSSSQFCVRLASGGDPTFSFNVRPVGEEVHGTSGSFRHFLSQISKELQGPLLNLLLPCPSSAANINKGKYVLHPGPMTFAEEKLLQFFGQLLGITIRADIPLPLDLLHTTWKVLVDITLDPGIDIKEVDCLTYTYIKKFSVVENPNDLQQLLEEHNDPNFTYMSMSGEEVELCPQGRSVSVSWDNLQQYLDAIRRLRVQEIAAQERVVAIRAGLTTIIPLQLLTLMTPHDWEMRTCGIPEIDLDFLKAHTMYQVGLMETDSHIEFFWNALESLSQDELRKFIKFACNQERIPNACPCRDGQSDTAHVPPYPMKIAPPDGKPGSPDSRYIRVETCMFMIKLPQYSSQEIMTERLLYAIHCREDPLSG